MVCFKRFWKMSHGEILDLGTRGPERHVGSALSTEFRLQPSVQDGAEAHCNMIGAHQCLMTYLGVDQKTLTISHHCSAQFPIISGQRCCSISKSWILSVGRSWAADVRKPDAIMICANH